MNKRAPFHITLFVMALHVFLVFLFSSPLHYTAAPPKKIVVVTKNLPPPPSLTSLTTYTSEPSVEPKELLKKLEQKTTKITPRPKPASTPLPKKSKIAPLKKKEPKKNPLVKKGPLTAASAKPFAKKEKKTEKTPTVLVDSPPPLAYNLPFVEEERTSSFQEVLSLFLEKNLILPEKGAVKLTITVQANGKIDKISLVAAESEKNLHYLQAVLPLLTMPALPTQGSPAEKDFECVITFCNGAYNETESD